jgi:hypothetical protein
VTILPVRPAPPIIDFVQIRPKGESSPTVSAWLELVRESLPAVRQQMEKGFDRSNEEQSPKGPSVRRKYYPRSAVEL